MHPPSHSGVYPYLIMSIAGIPNLRYSPHFESATVDEKPPQVAFGRPLFFFVWYTM